MGTPDRIGGRALVDETGEGLEDDQEPPSGKGARALVVPATEAPSGVRVEDGLFQGVGCSGVSRSLTAPAAAAWRLHTADAAAPSSSIRKFDSNEKDVSPRHGFPVALRWEG
ncbi:MAG: hypothetical protein KGI27_14395, partial [Thaumarchaeota archaeon]|nr:hypothetical protein [Nitrososphaerota archaeon]